MIKLILIISIYQCSVISIYRAKIATNIDIQEDTLCFLRVFIGLDRWLDFCHLLPTAVFYLAGNTQQAAFTCMNLISMITTTSAYIYAYYRMFRAIKTIGCIGQ